MVFRNKFWLFAFISILITAVLFGILAVALWSDLGQVERDALVGLITTHPTYLFSAVILMIAGIGFALDGIFHNYIIPLARLAEESRIIFTSNRAHRIDISGSHEVRDLALAINEGAEVLETLTGDIRQKISKAQSSLEEEKNILAAIMSELPQGVVICSFEGQVILFNRSAKTFLVGDDETSNDDQESGKFLGLGRSIFNIIDKPIIVHALGEVSEKIRRKDRNPATSFIVAHRPKHLLKSEIIPVLDHDRTRMTAFILIISDISKEIAGGHKVEHLLHTVTTEARKSLAGIRSAIESIVGFPQMDENRLKRLTQVIYDEAICLSDIIDHTAWQTSLLTKDRWPLVSIRVGDLIHALESRAGDMSDWALDIRIEDWQHIWVKVDSYSIMVLMLFLISRIGDTAARSVISLTAEREDRYLYLNLEWTGKVVTSDILRTWRQERVSVGEESLYESMDAILQWHEADLVNYTVDGSSERYGLRLFLPCFEDRASDEIRHVTNLPSSRPEFYDFDLFNHNDEAADRMAEPLRGITFTVFDTETTGLDPTGGDEIISIGAVRIVNMRILREELFDQLIDPQRSIPWESIKYHGIQPEMLKGQPTIEKALARFQQYAEHTVLLGHNVAFDMRMLQIKEQSTGIRFTNPVLDTMLLSAVIHPSQKDHSLEGIADRLGVSIVGRHTALGDAMATAEVFLKMIPLLEQRQIVTLEEARHACRKTHYARIRY